MLPLKHSTMIPLHSFLFYTLLFSLHSSYAINTITPTHSLKDQETLVSNNGAFTLGFFNFPNSKNRYLGIWYNHPISREIIWVANRNNPINDSSGILKLLVNGNLQVSNSRNETFWSTNTTNFATKFSVAQLLDYGNLIIQGFESNWSRENGTLIWQSFQHPTDSVLPNMRFVLTPNSDLRQVLKAWNSPLDPSDGRFSIGTNSLGLFQIIIYDGDKLYWRSGPWNGNIFIGTRYHNTGYGNILVNTGSFTQQEVGGMLSLIFAGANSSLLSHYVLTYQGIIAQRWWDDSAKNWKISWKAPENDCDTYAKCGEFGICKPQSKPICGCLKGFEPKNEEEWNRGNWSSGCQRKKELECRKGSNGRDGFLRLQFIKVPENAELKVGFNLDQCRTACLANCSCLAYAFDTQITCLTWSRNLIDVADLSPGGGVDFYLRLPQSELHNNRKAKIIIGVSVMLGTALVAVIVCFLWWFLCRKSRSKDEVSPLTFTKFSKKKEKTEEFSFVDKTEAMIDELHVFKFKELVEATNNFHESNLLGSGGFGKVFKGKLEDGQEIAVKRLSSLSGQGTEEFMNEVALISKLQHRNLVKLLGCCVEQEEKMLVYEYLPNKSLNAFLFDKEKRERLDWHTRFNIIDGVCRGLLYLHRDSRLKIIHRDLKASNILLDKDLNPKISDFGMARIFGNNQDQAFTQRVVGTYGYMSPEYAMEGHFSEKSDVFSLGVLLIEILSGEKNTSFWSQEDSLGLLAYAWKLRKDNNVISLIDISIASTCYQDDVIRCMQVGLLCVQEFAKDRPNISTIISMLVRDIKELPDPNPPVLFDQRQTLSNATSSQFQGQGCSENYGTVSTYTAR